ncbi:hypothetical protein H5410_016251 [Solanum commersonii]|uniref:Uncharacterized protein n=1 Tax=Solanum commersonii TaxID=4109 RepID=A0A9J5ZWH4_SOLCO|nr:hypothetical protein H5410_016251 [Solanum commersonii]
MTRYITLGSHFPQSGVIIKLGSHIPKIQPNSTNSLGPTLITNTQQFFNQRPNFFNPYITTTTNTRNDPTPYVLLLSLSRRNVTQLAKPSQKVTRIQRDQAVRRQNTRRLHSQQRDSFNVHKQTESDSWRLCTCNSFMLVVFFTRHDGYFRSQFSERHRNLKFDENASFV